MAEKILWKKLYCWRPFPTSPTPQHPTQSHITLPQQYNFCCLQESLLSKCIPTFLAFSAALNILRIDFKLYVFSSSLAKYHCNSLYWRKLKFHLSAGKDWGVLWCGLAFSLMWLECFSLPLFWLIWHETSPYSWEVFSTLQYKNISR